MRRNTIDLIVGSHDADCAGFAQGLAERIQKRLAQHSQRYVGRRTVHPGFRLPVSNKMLEGGNYVALVAEARVALESAYRSDAEARNEVRILAIGFFYAAPAWLACHVPTGVSAWCVPRRR